MSQEIPDGSLKRVAIIGPSGRAIARLRGGLIRDLVSRGHSVMALAPEIRSEDVQVLQSLGAEPQSFALRPEKFSLFPGRAAIQLLAARLKDRQPDAVLVFGEGIASFAAVAAKKARVPYIVLLVSELSDRKIAASLLKAAKLSNSVIVHNHDDLRAVKASAMSSDSTSIVYVPGAGADLAAMKSVENPGPEHGLVFACAARLDRAKGVREFCAAARVIKQEGLPAQFLLAGHEGSGAGAFKVDELANFAGAVDFLGDVPDLATILRRAHVFVSPSYNEGMPHGVLQAMAASRPIIVTDVPGSRETADETVNGIVVPPRDATALADAFRRILRHKDLLPAMGRASRAKAERQFDQIAVNASLRFALGLP